DAWGARGVSTRCRCAGPARFFACVRCALAVLFVIGGSRPDRARFRMTSRDDQAIAAAIPGAEVEVLRGVTHYTFLATCNLAGRTRRMRLGASVIVLPYRNALVAAKAAATVDQVSGGRFIFGVGVGWDEAEFVDLRLPFRERGRLSDDYLRAIKAAWAADIPAYKGEYVSFAGATFAPRPAQRPHPPIWVGGSPG